MGEDRRSAWRRVPLPVWTLGLVSLAMDVSSEMIHALLPVWLVVGLGASTIVVGVIEGLAEATASIVKVFSGVISDRFGKRQLPAAIGYGLAALSKPIFPLAQSLGWIVVARFVDRVGKGMRGAPRDALIADLTPADLRGAAFGLRQSLDTIGAFVGPLAAMALMALSGGDYRLVFWVAAVPAFVSFGLIVLAVRDPEPPAGGAAGGGGAGGPVLAGFGALPAAFWLVTGVATVFTLARFSEAFLILRAQSIGLAVVWIPAVMVVMNVVYAGSAYPIGALSDRIGRRGLLGVGLGLLIAADAVLAVATGPLALGLGVALWGLHMGCTQGVFAALVADTAPERLRGTAFGMFNLITGVALFVASLLAGVLWQTLGPAATFVAGAGFAAATLVALGRLPADHQSTT